MQGHQKRHGKSLLDSRREPGIQAERTIAEREDEVLAELAHSDFRLDYNRLASGLAGPRCNRSCWSGRWSFACAPGRYHTCGRRGESGGGIQEQESTRGRAQSRQEDGLLRRI